VRNVLQNELLFGFCSWVTRVITRVHLSPPPHPPDPGKRMTFFVGHYISHAKPTIVVTTIRRRNRERPLCTSKIPSLLAALYRTRTLYATGSARARTHARTHTQKYARTHVRESTVTTSYVHGTLVANDEPWLGGGQGNRA